MQALKISLKGEIESSNFSDWKTDLLAEIKTIGTSLATDAEFSTASSHVKQLKKAEKALKDAKQSALNQAADIQDLFNAIDEVREEARQTRLTLERQVKARKKEIRASVVEKAIESVNVYIAEQSEDFQTISHDAFIDPAQYTEALKGRSTLKTSEKAIAKLCENIKQAIDVKAQKVSKNVASLGAMSAAEQALFQDRPGLLAIEPQALNALIDKRLSVFRGQAGEPAADTSTPDVTNSDDELDLDFDMQDISEGGDDALRYGIVLALKANSDDANKMLSEIKAQFAENEMVSSVVLTQLA